MLNIAGSFYSLIIPIIFFVKNEFINHSAVLNNVIISLYFHHAGARVPRVQHC